MRQKRFQKGSVRPRKHGKTKVWVAQWWEEGRKKSRVLGRCTAMGKSEAEAVMAVILKPQNEDAGQIQKPVYTFGVYHEQVFLPMCRRKWKESTRMTTEPRMVFHLKPAFAPQVLRSISRDQMQNFWTRKPRHSRAALWTTSGGTSTMSSRQPSRMVWSIRIQPPRSSLHRVSRKVRSGSCHQKRFVLLLFYSALGSALSFEWRCSTGCDQARSLQFALAIFQKNRS